MTTNVVPITRAASVKGKPPAHDLVAEGAVLARCMLDPDAAASLMAIAAPAHFFSGAHRAIAEAIRDLLERNVPPEMTAVSLRLRESNRLHTVGGPAALIDMCNAAPSLSNPLHYAGIIHDLALMRALTHTLHQLLAESYEPVDSVGAFFAHVDAAVSEITRRRKDKSVVDALEVSKHVARALTEAVVPSVPTGFGELDRVTNGLERNCLYILAARTGMGKTALAMQMATAAAQAGQRVLVVSMEMPAEQLMRRMICSRAGVSNQTVRDRAMGPAQWSRFSLAASELAQLPIQFSARPGQTLLDIKAQVREHKPALVIVDHIGLMSSAAGSNDARRSREQEVAGFSRGLKALALDASLPVMALCQVNREVAKSARRPALSDLRESGAIEQDADGVWMIHRPGYYDPRASPDVRREAELIVAKQRDGGTPIIAMQWHGETMTFGEAAT